MYIIYISNYKKRVFICLGVLIIWAAAIITAKAILSNTLICSITIDNYLSFSYPFEYSVKEIYINQNIKDNPIETGLATKRPVERTISDFSTMSRGFPFDYPTAFILCQKDFNGATEILYHIDFQNNSEDIRGFIQLWNHSCDIKDFIERSISCSELRYEKSSVKEIQVNTLPGYYWEYTVITKDNVRMKGCEVFLCKNDRLYRISCFMEKSQWSKHKFNEFKEIVNSFKAR